MAASVVERFPWSFTGGTNPTWNRKYSIFEAEDELEAKEALFAALPPTFDGLILDSYNAEDEGNGTFLGEARYVGKGQVTKRQAPGSVVRSFDTGGATEHITQSKQTVNTFTPPGKTATNLKGAIGLSGDRIEGCDVEVSSLRFSICEVYPTATVTDAFIYILADLTGSVCDGEFKGYAAGEVMFKGAAGADRDDGNTEITYNFEVKLGVTGKTIGDIQNVHYAGWDYVWIEYAPAEDNTAKGLAEVPVAVRVERVYDRKDFSILGLD